MSSKYTDAFEFIGREDYHWANFVFPTANEDTVGLVLRELRIKIIKSIAHNGITYLELEETAIDCENVGDALAQDHGVANTVYEHGARADFRFDAAGSLASTIIYENEDEASISELALILKHEGPTKLAARLNKDYQALLPPSWDNQVEYGKASMIHKML